MSTIPELTDSEVSTVAALAESWRKRNGLTHEAFIARFKPYVLDSKGWHLIRFQPFSEWGTGRDRLRKGVAGLRAALADADHKAVNPLIETINTTRLARSLAQLRKQRTAQRFAFIVGPTGSGKSSTLDYAEQALADGRKIVRIRGREAWKSPREFLADWGKALGVSEMRESCAAAQTQVREALIALSDALVFVDEGHRMTATEINMLIDWSNDLADAGDSAVHFVIAAMDTLWSKLNEDARDEAAQLRVNRCLNILTLEPPDAEEVNLLLAAGCRAETMLGDDYGAFIDHVTDRARTSGSRAFVRDVRTNLAPHSSITLKKAREIADNIAAQNRLRR
jgi:type II secretory pathway predicted ATPase ExeA